MSSYEERLKRLQEMLTKPPGSEKLVLPPPKLDKIKRRTEWKNFRKTCQLLKREEANVMSFFAAELSVNASISEEGYLRLMHGYGEREIETILGKYIRAFVVCLQCKSCNTSLANKIVTDRKSVV